ncbi:MAG: hypothetical protein ACI9OJ_005684, partial [Myxococcota bacterium]
PGTKPPKAKPRRPEPPTRYKPKASSRQKPFPAAPYLKRILEHYVTHEHGFAAVKKGCDETLRVELYPLNQGWTAFAHYTRFRQEEKVDHITYNELPRFAHRAVTALLYNRRVEKTITRRNVLKADSERQLQTIKGSNHFATTVGTTLRMPVMGIDTAQSDPNAPVARQFRAMSTVDITLGYRGSFRSWGLDTYARLGIGANQKKAQRNNLQGGHIDHEIDASLGLSFFWYLDPDAVNSFYGGLGGQLDVSIYDAVKPTSGEYTSDNGPLIGAGLAAVGVLGYEFLRTSSIRPYAQFALNLPVYIYDTENGYGRLSGWIPSATLSVGALF